MITPKRKYWLLAANSKSDEYGEQSDKKENEILQNHWLQCRKKMKTMKKWERNSSHEEMKSKENSNRKKTSHKMEQMVEGY
jgi:hypothetical protein